jgi:hypothetical protein
MYLIYALFCIEVIDSLSVAFFSFYFILYSLHITTMEDFLFVKPLPCKATGHLVGTRNIQLSAQNRRKCSKNLTSPFFCPIKKLFILFGPDL